MATFFEQLRDHLHPRFELERELGSGGMGAVYLAHDPRLRRTVAVKVIPPEKTSAAATQRFTQEARSLAELKHKNIVTIYEYAPEDSPFFYFIMEHLEGETLEQRLTRGPLPLPEVVKLGRELIAALGAAHRRGVIHRDIKPSNIFLEPERAVLTDFGIAKSTATGSSASTKTGQFIGTPKYMAPEQWQGRAVPQSDFYSLGLVLYEAITGDGREETIDRENARWSAVPSAVREPLRRALAPAPPDRWPDAESFDRALWGPRSSLPVPGFLRGWSTWQRVVAGVAMVAVAVAAWVVLPKPRVDLLIARPTVDNSGSRLLGDSIVRSVADRMMGFPDFTVGGPGGRWRSKVTVATRIAASGTALTIQLDLPREKPIVVSTTAAGWHSDIEPLVDSLLLRLYSGSPLDSQLPRLVLPHTPAGLVAFLEAERAFSRAWWDTAYQLYDRAAVQDPTCVLCRLRHADVSRFLSLPEDTADRAAYRARVDDFPPQYQALIHAELVPLKARLDSLGQLNRRWPRFLFGRFRFADELIHRGPLIGRARREARTYFQRTSDVRRDFVPAWEHLVWLDIAEGNAQDARVDIDTLKALAPRATTPVRDLLDAASAWRLLPPQDAATRTAQVLPGALARQEPLDAGARYLNAFDDQIGAIWLGVQLDSANNHRESALLAQLFGHFGLGRPQRAAAVTARLVDQFSDPAIELFGMELEAAQLIVDPDSSAALRWEVLAARLHEFAGRAGMELRPRAEWMAALLTQGIGGQAAAVGRGTPASLVAILNAESLAKARNYTAALMRTDGLVEVESENAVDPFFRTILHFLRANWEMQLNHPWSADRELYWYQNTDVIEYPTGAPQPSEVDWAFGVLARWRRASLENVSDDRCRLYHDVARLWAGGEPRYAARADSARRALTALRCPASPS